MTEENKQLNKLDELKGKTIALSISDVAIFKDNPHLVFLYKKTEKLVSALYLLSSFISDKEPVKWQMREAGINLLSHSLSLSDRSSSERMLAYTNFVSTGLKFLSFLEVSYLGGIISEMNYNILKYEFETLIKTAETGEKGSDAKGHIFPKNFFEVPVTANTQNIQSTISAPITSKGQVNLSDKNTGAKPIRQTNVVEKVNRVSAINRQDIIIDLLKKNSELGIKDFTMSIKDCSEKTIQRELVSLVSKGLIKKDGEKRWSRYSLK